MGTEAQTRQELIDRQLARAGWGLDQCNLIEEFLLSGRTHIRERRAKYGDELADYVLLGRDGKPIAIVEAKRFDRDARAGERQASDYADRIKADFGVEPFIFLSNGQVHWFWNRDVAAPREVPGFFTPDDLDRLAFQRRYRHSLGPLGVRPEIAIS